MATSLSETNSPNINKRPKPQLKLNTNQAHPEEKKIQIRKNSLNAYIVENHPLITDISKSASASQKGPNYFFSSTGEESYLGTYYYILQKSNGKEQQDRYKASPMTKDNHLPFFGVYDGHSTQLVPEIVAEKLDQYFLQSLRSEHHVSDIKTALKNAFHQMEEEMLSQLKEKKIRGGTTALCAVFQQGKLYVANVGDSQAVIFQKEGIVRLSNLHDLHNASERFSVEQKGGVILKDRIEGELALSRSIGDFRFKNLMSSEPEILEYDIKDDDEYLLIGTDGYWNGLDPQQTLEKIKEFQSKQDPKKLSLKILGNFLMEEACNNIIKTKKDNMSLIVIDIKDYLLEEKKALHLKYT